MAPLVSVILPCFNAADSVGAAIDSLLCQSHHELEILALDDGSTDETLDVLNCLVQVDRRISVVKFATNQGLIAVLNEGLDRARGDFVARMDADDISHPHRLARQLAFLATHPDISVLGTATHLTSADTGKPLRPHPVRCATAGGAWFMSLLATPVAHPTIVARSRAVSGYEYGNGPSTLHTEDYDLFARMISDGIGFANLEQQLVIRRVRREGVSSRNESAQIANFVSCAREHLQREVGIETGTGVHKVLVNRIDSTVTEDDLRGGLDVLRELALWALRRSPENESDIRRVARLQETDILTQALRRGSVAVRLSALRLADRQVRLLGYPEVRSYWTSKLRPPRYVGD